MAAEIQEPEAPRAPSVAAQVDVPVDMVAQIAQRVVAQVSEKVVERIAWEVIPELAEALIKREIERLKAELQQLRSLSPSRPRPRAAPGARRSSRPSC